MSRSSKGQGHGIQNEAFLLEVKLFLIYPKSRNGDVKQWYKGKLEGKL